MGQITSANKEKLEDRPMIAEKNKFTAENYNEIKTAVNDNHERIITLQTQVIKSVKITLTTAEVFDLDNTPVTLLTAPGANKAYMLTGLMLRTYNETVEFNNSLLLSYGDSNSFLSTSKIVQLSLGQYSNVENQAVILTSNNVPTVGDGDLDVLLFYYEVDFN